MPCPFPGMDPYLEQPATWPGLHATLIAAIKRAAQPLLVPAYYAEIGERLYIEEVQHSVYPDVALYRRRGPSESRGGTAVLEADQPSVITRDTRHREPYLEIRATSTNEVVTVIEVLSPTNKTPGARGRDEYVRRQDELLAGGVHLVEIDLLRSGAPTVAASVGSLLSLPPWDYMVSVRRVDTDVSNELYAVSLRQRLPRVGIPLRIPDRDVVLDLPTVFAECYEEGGYAYRIDYRQPPPDPPLRPEDQQWLEARLAEAGLRPA